MRLKTILQEIVPLIFVIPLVMLLFRVIPDRKWAATFAGLLFVGVPLILMMRRLSALPQPRGAAIIWWIGVLQFWLAFAVPILGARVMSWDMPFENFVFFGQFSGTEWHQLSSRSYVVMVLMVLAAALWPRKAGLQEKQKASL